METAVRETEDRVGSVENWKPVRGSKGLFCSNEGRFRSEGEDKWYEEVTPEMVARTWLGMTKNQKISFRDGCPSNWAVSNLQLESFVKVTPRTKLDKEQITKEIAEQVLRYESETGRFMAKKVSKAGVETWKHAGEIGVYYLVALCGTKYTAQELAVLFMTGEWPRGEVSVKNQNWGDARWVNVLVK